MPEAPSSVVLRFGSFVLPAGYSSVNGQPALAVSLCLSPALLAADAETQDVQFDPRVNLERQMGAHVEQFVQALQNRQIQLEFVGEGKNATFPSILQQEWAAVWMESAQVRANVWKTLLKDQLPAIWGGPTYTKSLTFATAQAGERVDDVLRRGEAPMATLGIGDIATLEKAQIASMVGHLSQADGQAMEASTEDLRRVSLNKQTRAQALSQAQEAFKVVGSRFETQLDLVTRHGGIRSSGGEGDAGAPLYQVFARLRGYPMLQRLLGLIVDVTVLQPDAELPPGEYQVRLIAEPNARHLLKEDAQHKTPAAIRKDAGQRRFGLTKRPLGRSMKGFEVIHFDALGMATRSLSALRTPESELSSETLAPPPPPQGTGISLVYRSGDGVRDFVQDTSPAGAMLTNEVVRVRSKGRSYSLCTRQSIIEFAELPTLDDPVLRYQIGEIREIADLLNLLLTAQIGNTTSDAQKRGSQELLKAVGLLPSQIQEFLAKLDSPNASLTEAQALEVEGLEIEWRIRKELNARIKNNAPLFSFLTAGPAGKTDPKSKRILLEQLFPRMFAGSFWPADQQKVYPVDRSLLVWCAGALPAQAGNEGRNQVLPVAVPAGKLPGPILAAELGGRKIRTEEVGLPLSLTQAPNAISGVVWEVIREKNLLVVVSSAGSWIVHIPGKPIVAEVFEGGEFQFFGELRLETGDMDFYLEAAAWERLGDGFIGQIQQLQTKQWAAVRLRNSSHQRKWTAISLDKPPQDTKVASALQDPQMISDLAGKLIATGAESTFLGRAESTSRVLPRFGRLIGLKLSSEEPAKTTASLEVPGVGIMPVAVPSSLPINGQAQSIETLSQHGDLWIELSQTPGVDGLPQTSLWTLSEPIEVTVLEVASTKSIHLSRTRLPHGQVWIDAGAENTPNPPVELHIEIPSQGDGPRLPAIIIRRFGDITDELVPGEKLFLRARIIGGDFAAVLLQRPADRTQHKLAVAFAVSAQNENTFLVDTLDGTRAEGGSSVSSMQIRNAPTNGLAPRLGDLIWLETNTDRIPTYRPATQRGANHVFVWGRATTKDNIAGVQTAFGNIPFLSDEDAKLLNAIEGFAVRVKVEATDGQIKASVIETRVLGSLVMTGEWENPSWQMQILRPKKLTQFLLPFKNTDLKLGTLVTTTPEDLKVNPLELIGTVLERKELPEESFVASAAGAKDPPLPPVEITVRLQAWKHRDHPNALEALPFVIERKCYFPQEKKNPFVPKVGDHVVIQNVQELWRITNLDKTILLSSESQKGVVVAKHEDAFYVVRLWELLAGGSIRRFDVAVSSNGIAADIGSSVEVKGLFTATTSLGPHPLSAKAEIDAAESLKKKPVEEMSFVSDAVLSWNHWSIVTENPLFPAPVEGDFESKADELSKVDYPRLHLAHFGGPPDGSLPKMRYGDAYELLLPAQDLAGNVSTPENSDELSESALAFTCLRAEPISAPMVFKVAGLIPEFRGDKPKTNNAEISLDLMFSSFGAMPNSAELWLFPPPVSPGVLLGHLEGPLHVAPRDEEVLAKIDDYQVSPVKSEISLTYPHDPAAEMLAVRCVRYGETQELLMPVIADAQTGQVSRIRLRVRGSAEGGWKMQKGAEGGDFLLLVPPGESCLLEITAAPSAKMLEKFFVWDCTKALEKRDALQSSMLWGRMPLISGTRQVLVTHALRKLLKPPALTLLSAVAFQTFGSSGLPVACSLQLHQPSSGKIRIRADWEDYRDDPDEPLPFIPLPLAKKLIDPLSDDFPGWEEFLEYCRVPAARARSDNWLTKNQAFYQQQSFWPRFLKALGVNTAVTAFAHHFDVPVPPVDAPLPGTIRADFLHSFDDCVSRNIRYTPEALSRHFDNFFSTRTVPQVQDWVIGEEVKVTSFATLPPSPPEVVYMVPLFGKSVTAETREVTESITAKATVTRHAVDSDIVTTPAPEKPTIPPAKVPVYEEHREVKEEQGYRVPVVEYKRRSMAIRVYLRRPWYSSGAGELLGVVLPGDEPPDTDLRHHITEWGYDPVWHLPDEPRVNYAPLRPNDFEFRVAESEVNIQLPGRTGIQKRRVNVAAHEVRFCPVRGLWYCDIRIKPQENVFNLYGVFIRLCLARYQNNAVEGAKLSSIVTTDFIQLQPDRSLSVFSGPRAKRFILQGDFPIESKENPRRKILLYPLNSRQDYDLPIESFPSPYEFELKQEAGQTYYEYLAYEANKRFAVVEEELHSSSTQTDARRLIYMERVDLP